MSECVASLLPADGFHPWFRAQIADQSILHHFCYAILVKCGHFLDAHIYIFYIYTYKIFFGLQQKSINEPALRLL